MIIRGAKHRCPVCGCGRGTFCALALDGGGTGICAPAGDVPGHDCCSACLTPERRIEPRALFMPDEETVAELVRLGLAAPVAPKRPTGTS